MAGGGYHSLALKSDGTVVSIVCQEETYLKELVRYIHLNPLRAGIVDGLQALNEYGYCGHSALMGKSRNE